MLLLEVGMLWLGGQWPTWIVLESLPPQERYGAWRLVSSLLPCEHLHDLHRLFLQSLVLGWTLFLFMASFADLALCIAWCLWLGGGWLGC